MTTTQTELPTTILNAIITISNSKNTDAVTLISAVDASAYSANQPQYTLSTLQASSDAINSAYQAIVGDNNIVTTSSSDINTMSASLMAISNALTIQSNQNQLKSIVNIDSDFLGATVQYLTQNPFPSLADQIQTIKYVILDLSNEIKSLIEVINDNSSSFTDYYQNKYKSIQSSITSDLLNINNSLASLKNDIDINSSSKKLNTEMQSIQNILFQLSNDLSALNVLSQSINKPTKFAELLTSILLDLDTTQIFLCFAIIKNNETTISTINTQLSNNLKESDALNTQLSDALQKIKNNETTISTINTQLSNNLKESDALNTQLSDALQKSSNVFSGQQSNFNSILSKIQSANGSNPPSLATQVVSIQSAVTQLNTDVTNGISSIESSLASAQITSTEMNKYQSIQNSVNSDFTSLNNALSTLKQDVSANASSSQIQTDMESIQSKLIQLAQDLISFSTVTPASVTQNVLVQSGISSILTTVLGDIVSIQTQLGIAFISNCGSQITSLTMQLTYWMYGAFAAIGIAVIGWGWGTYLLVTKNSSQHETTQPQTTVRTPIATKKS